MISLQWLQIRMVKLKTAYFCSECGHEVSKWLGKCPMCEQWNTFTEEKVIPQKKMKTDLNTIKGSTSLPNINVLDEQRVHTGVDEFDRVMGGGVVKGSLTLFGGEPGIGKSTLLISIIGELATKNPGPKFLYISGEESTSQVSLRAKRLGIKASNLYLMHESSWEVMKGEIEKLNPSFIVIDSIQTTRTEELVSAAGSISQIRDVTNGIMNYAKLNEITCFIIGHITKDGAIAGPKILEHMVDTVVYFEGDQFGHYRMLRSIKNRYGNTHEVGIFEMNDTGLIEVKNPSLCFLESSLENSYGRSIGAILEGSRTLLIEIQALVLDNQQGSGRRTTQGFDSNRLSMIIAIVEKYFDISLTFSDVFLNVVGGMKLAGRDSDLAVIAAILSSHSGKVLDSSTVFIGEVGLTGEVRNVLHLNKRVNELAQLNYKRVITSAKGKSLLGTQPNIEIVGISKAIELENLI